jgi:hypothetical protein
MNQMEVTMMRLKSIFVAGAVSIYCASFSGLALAGKETDFNIDKISAASGANATAVADNVIRIGWPRNDVSVTAVEQSEPNHQVQQKTLERKTLPLAKFPGSFGSDYWLQSRIQRRHC